MKQLIQKKAAEYFFYFILYSFIGWVYEVFLEVVVYRCSGSCSLPLGILQQRGSVRPLLYHIRRRSSDSHLYPRRIKEKTDLPGPSVHHAVSRFCGNRCNHNRAGTDRKLYHGAPLRRVAVGLHPFFI